MSGDVAVSRRSLLVATTVTAGLAGCFQASCTVDLLENSTLVTSASAGGAADVVVQLDGGELEDASEAAVWLFDADGARVASGTVDRMDEVALLEFERSEWDVTNGVGEIHVVGPNRQLLERVDCSVGCS